jgi:hypothetical protein
MEMFERVVSFALDHRSIRRSGESATALTGSAKW